MDYFDYRTKLGLSFSDEEKQKQFVNRIKSFLYSNADIPFNREQENDFAYRIGESSIIEEDKLSELALAFDSPRGLQRVWLYLQEKQKQFPDFLAMLITMANSYSGGMSYKKTILNTIIKALDVSRIPYELFSDSDGVFVFPNGAKELDDALVSEPLEWLSDYPKSRTTFSRALKQYSDGVYARDVADNFRKALEEFFQEVLGNTKNLVNNKADICRYLNSHNAEPEIASMMQALLNSYDKLNNSAAKHNDKLDPRYLEFLMYQTGLIIRMIISAGAGMEA